MTHSIDQGVPFSSTTLERAPCKREFHFSNVVHPAALDFRLLFSTILEGNFPMYLLP